MFKDRAEVIKSKCSRLSEHKRKTSEQGIESQEKIKIKFFIRIIQNEKSDVLIEKLEN